MASDSRMYVMCYIEHFKTYSFIALNETQQTHDVTLVKIGDFITKETKYPIYRVTYSKNKCVEFVQQSDQFDFNGPELFVIDYPSKKPYIIVWKTKLTYGLEICVNGTHDHILFDDESKNLFETIKSFMHNLTNEDFVLQLDNDENPLNTHHCP